jgi:putative transposase
MPYIKAWFHLVWATKNRYPFLKKEIRQTVFNHVKENAKLKGIYLDCVNGYTEHIHCLVSLSSDQTISKVLQLIKGESSFWINKEKLCDGKFEWQDEYFAVSVSHSHIQKVRDYIYNQESHHQQKTFQEEYDEFIKNYQFEILPEN